MNNNLSNGAAKEKAPAGTSAPNSLSIPRTNQDEIHLDTLRAEAIKLVNNNRPVVPVGYNHDAQNYKLPLIKWQSDGPLTTVEQVEATFTQLGKKIFGIATIVDGYTLVDFDTEDTHKLFTLGLTPTVKTGKGYHMWYAASDDVDHNGPVPLTDFEKRDDKKYQLEVYTSKRLEILPPSQHHNGDEYDWAVPLEDFTELPPLPEEIKRLCGQKQKKGFDPKAIVSEGQRHSALKDACFYYFNQTSGKDYEKKVHDWNAACCRPVLPVVEVDEMIDWTRSNFSPSTSTTKKPSKADKLIDIIESTLDIVFFKDQHDEGYARIPYRKTMINVAIKGSEFYDFVYRRAYEAKLGSISEQSLKEVCNMLNARARFDGQMYELHYRVAQPAKNVFLYDLMDNEGRIVETTAEGVRITDSTEYPFVFRKGDGAPQVVPKFGGDLKDFISFINLEDDDADMIYVSLLPTRLIRGIDQPIAYLHGPAGSAKSTTAKHTGELLDPTGDDLTVPVTSIDDLKVMLSQGWLLVYDNAFNIDEAMSGFLCTVSTGGTLTTRKLYTNNEKVKMHFKNPMYFTGVNIEIHNSDLHARTIAFKTKRIEQGDATEKEEIASRFEAQKPYILGALFETLSKAIKIKDELPKDTTHRMDSAALWATAGAVSLGYDLQRFRNALKNTVEDQAYEAAYGIGTGRLVLAFMEDRDEYSGTMTELYAELRKRNYDDDLRMSIDENYPKNEASLGRKLRDIDNSLLKLGIRCQYTKPTNKSRCITITKTSSTPDSTDSMSEILEEDVSQEALLAADTTPSRKPFVYDDF